MNSKKRCIFCKEYFLADEMIKVPAGFVCSTEHAIMYAQNKLKNERKRALNERKKMYWYNDRSRQLKEAQKAFNEFIRLRDGNKCISCGKIVSGQIHAGHYRTVKAAPQLRFNQFNCHSQCAQCNNYMSGNIVEYRINLVKKIGIKKVEWIESMNDYKKLTTEEIRSIKNYYKIICKYIKQ